jgi:hypothetical protein
MKSKVQLIILSLIFCFKAFPQEDLKILSSDGNSITLEFNPVFSVTKEIINDQAFTRVSFPLGSVQNPETAGSPMCQIRKIPIGVPSEFGNTIEILSASVKEIEGRILPIPQFTKDGDLPAYKYEINDRYFFETSNEQVVSFDEFAIVRGMPVQYFLIKPVSFIAAESKIKLYEKIIFRINYSSTRGSHPKSDDKFLEGVIPNFDVAKNWIAQKQSDGLNKTAVVNSVLSAGKWIRFEAKEEGIYKITRSTLSSFGIDPNTVDPRTIKIYNNGGKMLPEVVSAARPNDLVENAILVSGEGDGTFDQDDYILFYGRGTNFWDYSSESRTIKRSFHPYSTTNYYWITYGGSNGKRMQEKPSLNEANKFSQRSTAAFTSLEEDKINIAKSGRVYLGDNFTQTINSRTYLNKLDGRKDNSRLNYNFKFVNASSGAISLALEENGTQIFSQSLVGYGSSQYSSGVAHFRSAFYDGSLVDSRSTLKFKFNPTSSTSIGYLDYFEINYEKDLKAYDDNLIFYSKDTTSIIEYELSGFGTSPIQVFDVSDYANVKIISNPLLHSGSQFIFQALEASGAASKYIAVSYNKYKSPINPLDIPNQNIRGYDNGGKLIIIYPKNFKEQVIRLKNHRENNSKLNISTALIEVNEIFNEFSCGQLDPTAIRDFIKYAYDNWTDKPEYVLLFGDGTYDYKNIEKIGDNLIPPYETLESLNELASYPMDDFFARVDGNDSRVDIAIGRLNINSSAEARIAVDKIIKYETDHENGIWRNMISLVADDNLTTSGPEGNWHTPQSETLANSIIPESFDINKIYLAAYPTVLTAIGRTKPGVYNEIINSVNRGTLIMNYVGHGSPDLWAHERVFVKGSTIPLFNNEKFFFLTAATCDFGYYDIPGFQSATELLVNKESSGSIGAFTSSRPVYSFENARLNEAFYSSLLRSPRDTMNLPIAVGKAYMKAKLIGSGNLQNDEKFHLYCDPSLRLNIPQFLANIDSVNGQDLSADVQIKALGSTRIDGIVMKSSSQVWDEFNGEGILTVFDSKRQVKLDQLSSQNNPYYVSLQGGIIFRGRISIINGRFTANFVVPKDISYENANGKILLYFSSDNGDGIGYTSKVKIGGTDSTTVNDGNGPEIEIYFDDESFDKTQLVNPNSTLIAKLSDQTGINTTGTGVGHKIESILNDRFNEPIDFTNFFTGDLDSGGKKGIIRYKFDNLAIGKYQILLKAWDVFNNPSSELFYFTVVPGNDLFISDIYNFPNPFSSTTTFTFQKNTINSPVDVDIKIYTITGRLIRNLDSKNVIENFVKVDWDGRDEDGNQISNGTYLYKLNVKSTDGSLNKSVLGKLAVIR